MNHVPLAIDQMREGRLLRIYLGESDKTQGKLSYEAVVEAARKEGLAGATVLRGSTGFGANSVVHHASPWRLSSDLPIIIEIVDELEIVQAFLPVLKNLLQGGGLITLERVRVLSYRPGEA